MNKCTKCKEEKPLTAFNRRSDRKEKHRSEAGNKKTSTEDSPNDT